MNSTAIKSPSIMPSETTVFHDPETGRKVRQLTSFKGNSHHLYFTNPGWWDGERKLLFGSDRMGRTNLFSVELESGEIIQHTDSDMPGPPRESTYQCAAVNPLRSECYFWRGQEMIGIDLKTNRERVLWKCPDGYMNNILNVSADGSYIYSAIWEDLSDKIKLDLLNGYVGFRECFEAHPHSQIIKVGVDDGTAETVWEEKNWIGHINTSPTQPHLISFCHEGPWDAVDNRMWMLDAKQSKVWAVRPKKSPKEELGHEYWHADGVTIGYHAHSPEAGHFFGAVGYDNSNLREASAEVQWVLHIHSLDYSLIVGDGGPYVLLWAMQNGKFGKARILCRHNGSSKVQKLHIHPRFSADGTKVVFTSDRTGYGQVYEVEVGNWQDLPVSDKPFA